ncbi:hypothetical protein KW785_02075 [Candidatus Parcubacteria bacterium]|nr:hypothetical protein [Candidatus Parcubacteria bacterium]
MKSLEKNKGTLIAIILFVLVIIFYNFFFKADQAISEEGVTAETIGNDIIALDQSLEAVTLDTAGLFNTPAYRALADFSPKLSPQPVGRAHPFDPVGK